MNKSGLTKAMLVGAALAMLPAVGFTHDWQIAVVAPIFAPPVVVYAQPPGQAEGYLWAGGRWAWHGDDTRWGHRFAEYDGWRDRDWREAARHARDWHEPEWRGQDRHEQERYERRPEHEWHAHDWRDGDARRRG